MDVSFEEVWEALFEALSKHGIAAAKIVATAKPSDLLLTWKAVVFGTVRQLRARTGYRLSEDLIATALRLKHPNLEQSSLKEIADLVGLELQGFDPMPSGSERRGAKPSSPHAGSGAADKRAYRKHYAPSDAMGLQAAIPSIPFGPAREPNVVRSRIFFVTDRRQSNQYGPPREFGSERYEKLTFGECHVTFPLQRSVGDLPRPRWWRFEFRPDPAKHAILRDVHTLAEQEFYAAIRHRLMLERSTEAFVFVHGYNVTFEKAALRTAQLALDLKFEGAAILFSWPSNGALEDYIVDHNNVGLSAHRLQAFLSELATHTGAKRVHVIAHSMGNEAVCAALHQLSLKESAIRPVHHVVLAAPDVDADQFRAMSNGICKTAGTVTLYASAKDKALLASKRVNGYRRAGEPLTIVNGIDTVDASAVDTDFLAHSYFSDDRSMLEDIYWLLRDKPASERFSLVQVNAEAGPYYFFRG